MDSPVLCFGWGYWSGVQYYTAAGPSAPDESDPTVTRREPKTATLRMYWSQSPPKTASSCGTRLQMTPSGEVHIAAS